MQLSCRSNCKLRDAIITKYGAIPNMSKDHPFTDHFNLVIVVLHLQKYCLSELGLLIRGAITLGKAFH